MNCSILIGMLCFLVLSAILYIFVKNRGSSIKIVVGELYHFILKLERYISQMTPDDFYKNLDTISNYLTKVINVLLFINKVFPGITVAKNLEILCSLISGVIRRIYNIKHNPCDTTKEHNAIMSNMTATKGCMRNIMENFRIPLLVISLSDSVDKEELDQISENLKDMISSK